MATMVTSAVLVVNWDNGDQKDDGKEDENKMSSEMRICLTEKQGIHSSTFKPLDNCAENDLCGKNTPDLDKRTEVIENEVQELVPLRARCESKSPPVMGNKSMGNKAFADLAPVGIHHNNHKSSRIVPQETVSGWSNEEAQPTEKERPFKPKYTMDLLAVLARVVSRVNRLTSSNSSTIDRNRLLPLKTAALGFPEFDTALAPVLMFNIRRKDHNEILGAANSSDTVKAAPQDCLDESAIQMSKSVSAAVSTANVNTSTPQVPTDNIKILTKSEIEICPSGSIRSASPFISANSRTATVASFKNVETELHQKDASSDNDNESVTRSKGTGGCMLRTVSRPLSAPMPRRSISDLARDLPTPRQSVRSVSLPDLTNVETLALFSNGEHAKSFQLLLDAPKPVPPTKTKAVEPDSVLSSKSSASAPPGSTNRTQNLDHLESGSSIHAPTCNKDRIKAVSSATAPKTSERFCSKSGSSIHALPRNKDRTSSCKSIFSKSSSSATPPPGNNARSKTTESNKNRSVARRNLTQGDSAPSAYTLRVIRENLRTSSLSVTRPEKSPQTPSPPKPTKAQKRKARRAKLEMYLSMSLNTQGAHREESSKTPGVTKRLIKITEDASPTTGTSGVRQKATVIDRAAKPSSTPNDPNEVNGVCASESPSLLSAYDIQESINSLSIHAKETRTQKRRRRREKAMLYASLRALPNDTTPANQSL
ncbi:uncharacterized protein LOC116603292 [Nematostella vectensis]|uniref:uncharacterized protein LOC116603292 n=1 Tax=Nematostella vectensis TaxID=45351 RepID=UPI00207767DC|nr:uncharacterized protein LOC116603292 [Nematostella vectensis]